MANVCISYLGLQKKGASVPPSAAADTPQKFYKVQIGAYTQKANADAMLAKVRAAGFDAVVKVE